MARFTGVIPPVVTPLTENHEVDYDSFDRVIEHLIAGGVHGMFIMGTTSEVVFHDADVRRRVIEHAVKVNNGRVPVFAGVIDPTTERMIAHAKIAEDAGVDALVVTAPFYARTSQPEIIDHFRYIKDAVRLPVIAYDIPSCVHIKLERDTTVALAQEGTITGLKDSSGDDGNFRYVMMETANKEDFSAMTGTEIVVDSLLGMGAHGVVPGLANVDPHGYVRLWNHCQAGDVTAAREEQNRLCRLFDMVRVGLPRTSVGSAGVGAFKTAMQMLGIVSSNTMARPQRTLNAGEAGRIRTIMEKTGLV